jgi:hypothetical protein
MKSFRSVLDLVLVSALALVGPPAIAQTGSVTFPGSDVLAKTGDSTTSSFKVFNSTDVELLRVSANGNIGIGTPTPEQKFEIFNGGANHFVIISTPLVGGFAENQPIGGLRLGWKFSTYAPNNVDLQVVRGASAFDGAGLAIFTSPSNTQTVERMRITSAGRVGIGSDTPDSRLMVRNAVNGTYAFHARQDSTYTANAAVSDVGGTSEVQTTISAGVTNSETALGQGGLIRHGGAGTLARAYGLLADVIVRPGEAGSMTTAYGVFSRVWKNNGSIGTGFGLYIDDVTATNDYGIWQQGVDDSNYFAGDVIIGPVGAVGNKLVVRGDTNVTGNLTVTGNFSIPNSGSYSVGGTAPSGYPFFATSSTQSVSTAIQLHSGFAGPSTSFIGNLGGYGTYISHNREPQDGAFTDGAVSPNQLNAVHAVVGDSMRQRLFHVSNFPGGTETVRLMVKYNGNVGIGSSSAAIDPQERLVVDGNINVTGNINAKYQDIAEWVPASNDLSPGTVVVLNHERTNEVMSSHASYDTSVAGVVSAQPGVLLGEAGDSKEQIATTGRVRVWADASVAAIRIGDLLVTSDKPGMAMRSEPLEIGGRKLHQPGTIIGKALEPLDRGTGQILVLLSLQ